MTIHKAKWLLAGLVCLALWTVDASAQGGEWESYRDAGIEAFLQGDYAEAEKQFATAIKVAEGFGPEDPRLAESLNGLAEVYRAQGKYEDAERLHRRALAIRESTLGPGHPDLAQSLNGLAEVFKAQGKFAEAESFRNRALAIEQQVAARVRLWQSDMLAGGTAYQQGNYAEAEKRLAAGLEVAEGFGPQAPRLATNLDNLAELFRVQGRYADAEPLQKRALAIREKALGAEHPDVAQSLNNLALIYGAQGHYAEAWSGEVAAHTLVAAPPSTGLNLRLPAGALLPSCSRSSCFMCRASSVMITPG